MLLPRVGAPWKSLPWEGWGRFVWNRRKTSICQNVLFKNLTSSYPLEVCICASAADPCSCRCHTQLLSAPGIWQGVGCNEVFMSPAWARSSCPETSVTPSFGLSLSVSGSR